MNQLYIRLKTKSITINTCRKIKRFTSLAFISTVQSVILSILSGRGV